MSDHRGGVWAGLQRRPLLGFFVLAYAGSWICWLPALLGQNGIGLLPYRLPLGVSIAFNQVALFAGPFLASIVMSKLTEGSLRGWLSRLGRWRAPLWAYVISLVAIPAAIVVSSLLLTPVSGEPQLAGPAAVVAPVIMFVAYFIGGPLQEEPGWRGDALPRMQAFLSPLVAAVALGVVWGLWHLPQFLIDEWETPHRAPADVAAFVLFAVGASVLMSWVTNLGHGSVLLAMLAHNALNWILTVWPLLTGRVVTDLWPAAAALLCLAAVAAVVTGGRLGLPRSR